MKKLDKKFKDIAENVRLSGAEKRSMRSALSGYQAMKPLRTAGTVSPGRMPLPSPLSFFSYGSLPAFLVLTLLFVGSAGASVAAEHALPGDLLYPLKVSVNEKVAGVLAVSEEAKAAHETALAGTRLAEAEALSLKNGLSSSTAASLEANFTAHADSARSHIAALQETDARKADAELSTLATVLSTHKALLAEAPSDGKKANLVSAIRFEAAVAADLAGSDTPTMSAAAPIRAAAKAAAPAPESGKTQSARAGIRALLQSIVSTSTKADGSATSSESSSLKGGVNFESVVNERLPSAVHEGESAKHSPTATPDSLPPEQVNGAI